MVPPSPQYRALNPDLQEIRTLTLNCGEFEDTIHCVLNTVSLIDRPRPSYTALSYVWGDSIQRLFICVDGIEVSVTKNLALALRNIRRTDRNKVLWVDAICINQNDINERSSQVQLMGTLYSEAEAVIIWLGEADAASDELAHIINETDFLSLHEPELEDSLDAQEKYAVQYLRTDYLVLNISMKPWWRRVWTFQECVLPRNDPMLQCGTKTFSWKLLSDMVQKICASHGKYRSHQQAQEVSEWFKQIFEGRGSGEMQNMYGTMFLMQEMRRKFKSTPARLSFSLRDCLYTTIGRQTSLPHDYIYGYFGLIGGENEDRLHTDYTLPCRLLYRKVSQLLIETEVRAGRLVFFSMFSFHKNEPGFVPSWVPDFSDQLSGQLHAGFSLTKHEEYFGSTTGMRYSKDGDTLMLQGILLDVVDYVVAIQDERKDWPGSIASVARKVRSITTSTPNLSSIVPLQIVKAAKETHDSQLFYGTITPQEPPSLVEVVWDIFAESVQDGYKERDGIHFALQKLPPTLMNADLAIRAIGILFAAHPTCAGRSIMRSRSGINGLCVPGVQSGDEIVCL